MSAPYDFYDRKKDERSDWEKLKQMSGSARIQYIYDNYLAQLIVGTVLLVAAGMIITAIYNSTRPKPWLNIGVLDYDAWRTAIEQTADEELGEIIAMAWQGADYESLASGAAYNSMLGIAAVIAGGDVDAMLASDKTILFLQKEKDDYFYDLSEVFTAQEIEAFGDRILYGTDAAYGEYPLAIDLSDSLWFQEQSPGERRIYLVIAINSPQIDHVKEWVERSLANENIYRTQ